MKTCLFKTISGTYPSYPLMVILQLETVMKNDMTAAVVAKNLFIPKGRRVFSKRSDELVVQDFLPFSVKCANSVSNIGQCLLTRTRQVESLMAEVASLRQEIRGLKHENRELHKLANNYSTSVKRKLDQLQDFESWIQCDHQRFVALSGRHQLPPPSGVLPITQGSNDQLLVPYPSGVLPSTEASHDQSL